MKDFYHICMTAHKEVLLRDIEDVALITNLSALSAYRSGAALLTDSVMSTHLHETTLSPLPEQFAYWQQLSITKAFNHKHSRKGPLFDGKPYILRLEGPRHTQMALNYTLRQGLHHGQSETAFDYPWSTCNCLFTSARGVQTPIATYKTRREIRNLLPKNVTEFPDEWQADENGILLRNTFEELSLVQNWYGTARNYIYSMIRRTSEEWLAEQNQDSTDEPTVTLESIEQGFTSDDISRMISFEVNSKYSNRARSDMDLCRIIDTQMLSRFRTDSVYQLSKEQKTKLANEIWNDLGVHNKQQISRCVAMEYDC